MLILPPTFNQETAVNRDTLINLQLGLNGIGRLLMFLGFALLLSAIGLGWLIKSFFVLLVLVLLSPIVAFAGFRWWLQKNVVQDACPVCHQEVTGFRQRQFQCPSCGEQLQVEKGRFQRVTPSGTIDVEAVEVAAQVVEE